VSASVATKPGPYVGAWTGSSQWRNRPRQPKRIARPHRIDAWEAHMKRILLGTLLLAAFGLALAGPPVDYQLYCVVEDVAGDEPIGVASLVDDQLHVALIDGALAECEGTVVGMAEGEPVFTVTVFTFDESGELTDFQVAFTEDETLQPSTNAEELPAVAIEGMLGAQQNRADAFRMAEEARARGEEHAGGPPIDVPGEGDDEEEGAEEEVEIESEEDGPPMELPEPATRGRP
jgi:hypothetical protein